MLSDVGTQLRSKTLLEKGGRSPPSIPHAQNINYYDILHTVPCGPLCHALICTHKYSLLQSTLPCSHMYSYIQSLAVHSAMLSCVLKLYRGQSTYVIHQLRDLYLLICHLDFFLKTRHLSKCKIVIIV